MTESTRAYLYRVSLAVLAIVAAYGYIEESKVALFVALIGALLPVGLAAANTSTKAP